MTYKLSKSEWAVGRDILGYTDEAKFAALVEWADRKGYWADWSEFDDDQFIGWHTTVIQAQHDEYATAMSEYEAAGLTGKEAAKQFAIKQALEKMKTVLESDGFVAVLEEDIPS
jgi:hypothetical protein